MKKKKKLLRSEVSPVQLIWREHNHSAGTCPTQVTSPRGEESCHVVAGSNSYHCCSSTRCEQQVVLFLVREAQPLYSLPCSPGEMTPPASTTPAHRQPCALLPCTQRWLLGPRRSRTKRKNFTYFSLFQSFISKIKMRKRIITVKKIYQIEVPPNCKAEP